MIDYYELDGWLIRLAAEDNYFDKEIEDIDKKERRTTDTYFQHKFL